MITCGEWYGKWMSFGLNTLRHQITHKVKHSQIKVNIYARAWFHQWEITRLFLYTHNSHIDKSDAVRSNENDISPINSRQSNWFTDFVRICVYPIGYYCIYDVLAINWIPSFKLDSYKTWLFPIEQHISCGQI